MGDLFDQVCSYDNLILAFRKAKRRKSKKPYVIEFERNLSENLFELRTELLLHSYRPKPLKTFVICDPKTRKISKSEFRDRVVHHALCNVIEPIFDKSFIHDSYANRKNKGSLKAIQRFDYFKRKVSASNTKPCFIFKADIKHYFDRIDHEVLISLLKKKVGDESIVWLIRRILDNFNAGEEGKGMPLGNLTSQFFANIYLDKLDKFVKHELRAKYYLRYVDDFVILHKQKHSLENYKKEINNFLEDSLKLELHPDKSRILDLKSGIQFLGYRIFYHHKLLRKSNIKKFKRNFELKLDSYKVGLLDYQSFLCSLNGWLGYAVWANTYKLRSKILQRIDEFEVLLI